MRVRVVVATVVCLIAFACASPHVVQLAEPSLGDPCDGAGVCSVPLVCGTSNTCEPSGAIGEGGACVISADCAEDLFCDRGSCAPAGTAAEGEGCDDTADCQAGLRCDIGGLGGVCTTGGDSYLDEPCAGDSARCLPGLVCAGSTCATNYPAPIGNACTSDADCSLAAGIVCDVEQGLCQGLGPDGATLPVWPGATCPDPGELDGEFRVLFEVPGGGDDFFRQPYPSDARLDDDGHPVLTGFPHPSTDLLPTDVFQQFLDGIAAEQYGFGPNQTVFMRFSGPPRFCNQCGERTSDPACITSCMGEGEPVETLYVADITEGSTGFLSNPWNPVSYSWAAGITGSRYLCGPWLALWPTPATPWKANRTYAIFVRSIVSGWPDGIPPVSASPANVAGAAMHQDTAFAALLGATAPADPTLAKAWDAHAPLRAWLASAPSFPNSGGTVTAADIAGAAVFTVRDPTRLMVELADAVDAGAAALVHDVAVCAADDCSTDDAFTEVRGRIDLPIFQTGTAPYKLTGGAIAAGPAVQATTPVRFALSVPTGTAPAAGWPVIVYGHGTGGDYRSAIDEELASRLAAGFAVLGFDAVAHGERGDGSPPDLLFFNLANPSAARGNMLQAATDVLSVQKALPDVASAVSTLGIGELDPTQVAYLGHSQGGETGVLAMAVAEGFPVAVLSGAGGGLIDALTTKRSPHDLLSILRVALADPTLDEGRSHPALSLLQGYMEEADPVNYAPFVSAQDIGRGQPKHLLHFIGTTDTYTPDDTSLTLARRFGAHFIDTGSGLLSSSDATVTPPVRKNRGVLTRASSVHVPASGHDGHFVMFEDDDANLRMTSFFATWQSDAEHAPTIVP